MPEAPTDVSEAEPVITKRSCDKEEHEKTAEEKAEDKRLKDEKMKKIVGQTPGATIFQEGMKVPGQEEREEREGEWLRGEFDPMGDLVVTGRRVERGEGRSAEEASGPQPGEWDDLFITLCGTPVVGAEDPFFVPRGMDAALANRLPSKWLVELSNPLLSEYWAKSLRAMSRGDLCRFTIAAKKAQGLLQNLADCCDPLQGGGDAPAPAADRRITIPAGRVQVQPCGRQMVVDIRVDRWLGCASVSKRGKPKLYKRLLEVPAAALTEAKMSQEDRLAEQLRHAGDYDREEPRNKEEEEQLQNDPLALGGRMRRAPRPPDRIRLTYSLRRKAGERTGLVQELHACADDKPLAFNLGGKLAGGRKPWAVLEECVGTMEEGERSSFTFAADAKRLPLAGGATGGGASAASEDMDLTSEVAAGDVVELDLNCTSVLRQKDVSPKKDLSVTKCKMGVGKGFWKPRPHYKLTLSAAPAPSDVSSKDGARPPPRTHTYDNVEVGGAGLAQPLNDMLYTMSLNEVALLTAQRTALRGKWPKGGPLTDEMPPAAEDGTVTLWVRIDAMYRVEAFGEGEPYAFKQTLNGEEDLKWMEKAFVDGKGNMPCLEEDVLMVIGAGAADGTGKALFAADRQLKFRVGDLPFAEDWVLMMLMGMYHGERAEVRASGEKAAYLLKGVCELRKAHGGCQVDAAAAAQHVAGAGLVLSLTILNQEPPLPRDGIGGAALIAAAEDIKERANKLLNAGYTGAAMRKYVRATWLMQDGKEEYDPGLPMTEVVGTGRGDEPRKTRFTDNALHKKANELRLSLHLNMCNGALKIEENYGAMAAALVARKLAPNAVKPMFREAQCHVALQDFTAARELLTKLLQIDPQNAAARKLREQAKAKMDEVKAATKRQFTGMFSRGQREGPLYDKAYLERVAHNEKERTQFQADRAEERRRGVQMMNTEALARTPEEYQQKQIDEMNEAIENDHKQSEIPDGLTEEQFQRLLQMRTDGIKEEKIQTEMRRMRREDMENTRKYMLRTEIERMGEMEQAIGRDRYKSDEVIAEREREYMEAYKEIKKRVERRKPMLEAEERRQAEMAKETQAIFDDPEAEEEDKARAMRKMLHDPFKDLDAHLTDAEMHELNECKARPSESDPTVQRNLNRLLALATERRIEAHIDELLDREDDVLV